MMQLFIQPVDTWLFRDGRPFSAGSDHRAESVFPPYPTTLQGAIRSYEATRQGIDLRQRAAVEKAVGTVENYYKFSQRGPFLARWENGSIVRYFPQPADAFSRKDSHELRPASRPQPQVVPTCLEKDLYLFGARDEPAKPASGLWLNQGNILAYLALDPESGQNIQAMPASELYVLDERTAIGKDYHRNVVLQGALYEVGFIRPREGVGLLVDVLGYTWPESQGVLQLGGESRAASFEIVNPPIPWPEVPDPLPRRFKVYFATPACFYGGWRPVDNNWSTFFEGKVVLRTAALTRYESLGGFDWASKTHKPALRYVPAGSVYYFECDGSVRLNGELVQGAITDIGSQIGFGQVIISSKEW
jgi:CRISPR-associated protein Cmr3